MRVRAVFMLTYATMSFPVISFAAIAVGVRPSAFMFRYSRLGESAA
jgi:hypothetical protein